MHADKYFMLFMQWFDFLGFLAFFPFIIFCLWFPPISYITPPGQVAKGSENSSVQDSQDSTLPP